MPRKPTGNPSKRPSFKPTEDERRLVESMCAVGIPHDGIALCLRDKGIDEKTLRKHFRRELDTAKLKANAKVGGSIFRAAIAGNASAQNLWAKTQMGWKETSVQEHAGKDGGPIVLWGKQPQ